MKRYGANKSTEFTSKQISVIYGKAKSGVLKVEKWVMKEFYNLADYYGYDYNGSVAFAETMILSIIDCVFAGKNEEAQEKINAYTEYTFASLSTKEKGKIDHSLVA